MTHSEKTKTQQIVFIAILVAIYVILSRFLSISAWNFRIGFSFVPVLIAAVYLGKWQAGIVGGMGDFIGAMLFPLGRYFPGFTLVAFLTGTVYGLFLHKKQSFIRIFCVVVLTQLVGSVLINSLWISLLNGAPYWTIIPTRLIQAGIMTIIQCVVMPLVSNYIPVLQQHTT